MSKSRAFESHKKTKRTKLVDLKSRDSDEISVEPLIEEDDFITLEPPQDENRKFSEEAELVSKEPEFQINPLIHQRSYEPLNKPSMTSSPLSEEKMSSFQVSHVQSPIRTEDPTPKEIVKVNFGKFVQLVASHDFTQVIAEHPNEDLIISSNLLTELAGSQDKGGERKIPLVFLVGIAIGVVLTYILFSR